jgi:hypothetical protein
MATYLDAGKIAWNGDIYKSGDKHRDKYFEKDKKTGYYKLKDGYESRYLGSGEKTSSNGAIATYTNAFDDLHDDYDANKDRKNYGIYKVSKPQTKTVIQQVAAPAPKPKPVEKKIEPGSFKYSPEIQQAKDRVKSYEAGESPWEQAQATVQSSFIKPSTSSNSNQQYDFSADSFNANESPEPNEQAQAAQNQLQNYVSKYSQYKSSAN